MIQQISMASFVLLMLFFTSSCTTDKIAMYGRFVGTYEKYDEAVYSLTRYLNDNEKTLTAQEKSECLLLIGIAYQKKCNFKQSMDYYNQSLAASSEFNYFALLQKASIYKAEKNYQSESDNLKDAAKRIKSLLLGIRMGAFSEDEIRRCENFEFVINYYINKNDIKIVRQSYSVILENKLKQIENSLIESLNMQ